ITTPLSVTSCSTLVFSRISGSYESGVTTPLRAILSVIIVFSIRKNEIKYDVVQVASKGNNALDCPVVSRAKTIDVRNALEAPANNADIPTSTANGIFIPTSGNQYIPTLPSNAPAAPPMVIKGASVPPEVPLL